MNYANIKYLDVANGAGCRTSLFVSGCTHHCRGCFNAETWDFQYGRPFDRETEDAIIRSLLLPYNEGLSILGGEPFELPNQKALLPFIRRVRDAVQKKNIWVWSGYTWEELTDPENRRCHSEDTLPMLEEIDVLVDGEFVLEQKNMALRFRGSANQRILDVRESIRCGQPMLSHYRNRD